MCVGLCAGARACMCVFVSALNLRGRDRDRDSPSRLHLSAIFLAAHGIPADHLLSPFLPIPDSSRVDVVVAAAAAAAATDGDDD